MARAPSDITKWNPGNAYELLLKLYCNLIIDFFVDHSAVWVKIHEAGKDSSGKWAATDILYQNNHLVTVKIPEGLRAGQYIIRHEIIALHAAWSYP